MSTTEFAPGPSARFDTTPLSWVMVEIREALGRSKTALFEAGGRALEERSTSLQHAKSHLHQARSALQMIDIDGVDLITEAAELALDRFKSGALKCSVDHVQIVANLYQALVEYLEELLAGAPVQPVRLFPYYRAVQEMLDVDRIHPAALFFPDLTAPLPPLPMSSGASGPDYPTWHQHFENALLPFLQSAEPAAQRSRAGALQETIKLVADAQQEPPARTFWFAMQSFAQLVALGKLSSSLYVKQLFGLINLQLRRLAQGVATLPDEMLRDALFFIAAVEDAPPDAQQLRRAYRLDGLAPPDFERKRYGQIDPEALARAKHGLALAKARWAEIELEQDASLADALARVALETDTLRAPALSTLLRQLGAVAQAADRNAELGMETATGLLFAEHGLDQIRRLPDHFAANAATIVARLQALLAGETPPAPVQWQGDLAHQIKQEQTIALLVAEMKSGLSQVEKVLDDYHVDPLTRPALVQAELLLHQLDGALALLDQDHAMRAVLQMQAAVQHLARLQDTGAGESKAQIAQNICALGFFVDMLGHNADAARERFQFDEALGAFRAIPFEKIAAAGPVPVLGDELVLEPVSSGASPAVPDGAIAAELRDIFISEAQDMLSFVRATLARPRQESASVDNLTLLRRSFHTLKGSAQMVGLNQFAAAAASIERVLNVWLSDGRSSTDDLFALLDRAARDLGAWVAELLANGASGRAEHALVNAARQVQDGAPFVMPDEVADALLEAGPQPVSRNVIEFPSLVAPSVANDDHMKHVGELEIGVPLYNIYLAETDELLRFLARDFSEWQYEPQRPVSSEALHAAHTLSARSDTVGFKALGQLAHGLEMAIQARVPSAPALDEAQHGLLTRVVERVRLMLQNFALGELAPEQPELVAALDALRKQLADRPQAPTAAAFTDQLDPDLLPLFLDESADSASDPASDPPPDTAPASANMAMVQVRADILDRLVDQAGEVSISRAKLENEVGALRASLSDFSENMTRLRRQLREVEMQAESQIASYMAISSTREFDPLEFDRFTRLQELTRMMAESVNHVATFHQHLARGVDNASVDLEQQASLTSALQRDLIQVRFTPHLPPGPAL